jgi:nitroreductase
MNAAMEAAVAAATCAPSVHNTQPWLFHIADDRIEIRADFSRRLDFLDPTSRQLYVSCGAAVHHLKVALRGVGFDAEVLLVPDGDPAHVATVVVSPGEAPDSDEIARSAAIGSRHTQREPFADRQISHSTLDGLRKAAESEGAWLAIVDDREDQIMLTVLLSHADEAEGSDPAYLAELNQWRRSEPAGGAPASDGIPQSAIPDVTVGRHSDVPIRDFALGGASAPDPDDGAVPDEKPALLILGTDDDSPTQWLKAGESLSSVLLYATVLGLRASMLGQVIDLPGTRSQLRNLLRLVGEPQMVLRVGYGAMAAATPRRPVSEVLI